MIKKFTLLLLAMLCIAGTSKATDYELGLLDLSAGSEGSTTYNSTTKVISFASNWSGCQWWLGTLDISGYGEFVLEYVTSSTTNFYIDFYPSGGSAHRVTPTANAYFGRTVVKLDPEFGTKNIEKIIIGDTGSAFTMTLKRAYFRSKTNENSTWSQDVSWEWTTWTNQYLNDAGWKTKFANAKVEDIIRITYSSATEGSSIYSACDASSTTEFGNEAVFSSLNSSGGTVEYIIPNAAILENIQLNGMVVKGQNATITNVSLYSYTESYDAVPVTIGSDGIATFSTSSKRLDFTGTDIYPYYASNVETGTVTLTKLENQITYGWQGYILKGSAGTYDIPVTTADGTYPGTNYLKPTGDYSRSVAASVEGTIHYIFAKDNTTGEIGFYKLVDDAHTLAAHKAYLETTTDYTPDPPASPKFAGSRALLRLSFGGGEGTTAINTALKNPIVEDGIYYTLQGVAVKNPSKGIYILNGKKVFIK